MPLRRDMVVSYVRDLIAQETGVRPDPDGDGDLPVRFGGALFYARVTDADNPPVVQVFSVALADLDGTAELHSALNEVNSLLRFARAFHVRGQVLIESELWGTDVNPDNFSHACWNVARATDAVGHDLAARFGGTMRFEESKTAEYEGPRSAPAPASPYL